MTTEMKCSVTDIITNLIIEKLEPVLFHGASPGTVFLHLVTLSLVGLTVVSTHFYSAAPARLGSRRTTKSTRREGASK